MNPRNTSTLLEASAGDALFGVVNFSEGIELHALKHCWLSSLRRRRTSLLLARRPLKATN